MATTIAEAFVTIRPDTSGFEREAGRGISRGLSGLGKIAGVAMAAVGAAVVGTAVAGVKAFAQFERGMNEVFTLLPGISRDAMKSMEDDVKSFAMEFGVLPEEVIPALYQALSAGVPQDNVFAFLETAHKAAVGGVSDLETAVDGISSVVNAYGLEVLSAEEASDLMFTTVRLGKTNFEELSESLFNVIPTAASLGVGFDEVSAALAAITAQGVPTSVATTQLRQLFVELSKAGGETATIFEDIAGQSFGEFIESGGTVQEALQLLEEHARGSGGSLSDMFGSVEAGQAALALTGEGTERFSANLDAMAESAGATDEAYARMNEGLGRAFEKLRSVLDVVLIEVGERLAPLVEKAAGILEDNMPAILEALGVAFDALEGWVTDTLMPALDDFAVWMAEDGPAAMATARENIESFKPILDILATAFDNTNETASSTERGAARSAAALNSFNSALQGNGSAIHEWWTNIARTFAEAAASAVYLSRNWEATWGVMQGELAYWWARIVFTVTQKTSEMWTAIRTRIATIAVAWREWWGDMWARANAMLETIKGVIRTKLATIVAYFKGLPGRAKEALGDLSSTLKQKGRDFVQGFIDGIKDAAGGIGSALATLVERAWTAVSGGTGDGYGLEDLFTAGGGGSAPPLRPAAGYRAMTFAGNQSGLGLTMSSGFRPGAITATGNPSYHGMGRATDWFGTPAQMAAFSQWVARNYGSITKELIYSGPGGVQLHNGRPHYYSGVTRGDHFDHVHWALAQGGWVKAKPGVGVIANIGEGSHDEVVAPEPMLRKLLAEAGTGGPTNITVNGFADTTLVRLVRQAVDERMSTVARRGR